MDLFATKGIEYILVIGYLLTLILYWGFLRVYSPERPAAAEVPAGQPRLGSGTGDWFEIPEGFHFHRGHTWALPDAGNVFRVGIDDFAQKLLGPADALQLPLVGERLEQGEPGWRFFIGGHSQGFLSPVGGVVIEINQEVLEVPKTVCNDPYGRGWLLKVRVPQVSSVLKNLLPVHLARTWTKEATARLCAMMGRNLGVVLQDGGIAMSGIARQLAGENWRKVASEILMTE
jgi:glycine cleavage system H lipoate-binding protein